MRCAELLLHQKYLTENTDNVFLTAFPKVFTNIEYASEIFANMKELAMKEGFSFLPNLFNNEMAIEIEARHKAVSKTLLKNITNNTLVIEIAAGLSPRRLEFKEYDYLEVDFKPIMDVKRNIYKNIKTKRDSFQKIRYYHCVLLLYKR